ncbi:Predicted short chain-type dehydrogenase [Phaffia rhodozyma]|uniref:Predicted short chain-type dehydrogenase n=1 Tax=Phaffia rhodozyma TaxID=264483 RepID=A0A0F7SG31_PHARH|nr:Predicted short chain-type dehydrogenase [Phaffia rhodozyma]
MPLYFVTASSRGIGLELVRQLSTNPDVTIIAAARKPTESAGLMEIVKNANGRVETLELDVTNPASIKAAVDGIPKLNIVKANNGTIDTVLHVAGTMSSGWKPATRVSIEELELDTKTNYHGPILLTIALLPILTLSPPKPQTAKVLVISSLMGSTGALDKTGDYAACYSSTKVAVNMWFRKLAIEIATGAAGVDARNGGWCIGCLHPGLVKTDMTRMRGDITVEESCSGMIKVIDRLSESETGKFFDWRGEEVPW